MINRIFITRSHVEIVFMTETREQSKRTVSGTRLSLGR